MTISLIDNFTYAFKSQPIVIFQNYWIIKNLKYKQIKIVFIKKFDKRNLLSTILYAHMSMCIVKCKM